MREDLSWIAVITDRSGSMESIRKDAIGGFNSFVEAQRDPNIPGEALVTLVLFDDRYEVPYSLKPVRDVPLLTDKTFVPRGSTALLDAIGRTIVSVGADINALSEDEKPKYVIIVILTDGEENSSREFTNEQIKEMITHQTDVYKWQFIYIAANVDTFATAVKYGIPTASSYSFEATREGTQTAYATMSSSVAMARSGGTPDNWSVQPDQSATVQPDPDKDRVARTHKTKVPLP